MTYPVDQSKIHFYNENGFVQMDGVLSKEEIAELALYMEEAMSAEEGLSRKTAKEDGGYYRVLNQKVNVWRDHLGMARYSSHRKLADIALQLSGANGIRLFHDHALWKMPLDSKETPWHQDFPYWPMNESGALSAWIPLEDVHQENGCMMFVPGSHKIGKLHGIDLTNPQNIFDFEEARELSKTQPIRVPLKAGSCTFHNGLTFHFAHANRTERPRRVLAIIYMPDGTTYDGKSHIVTNGLPLEVGKPIQGGTFPLLTTI